MGRPRKHPLPEQEIPVEQESPEEEADVSLVRDDVESTGEPELSNEAGIQPLSDEPDSGGSGDIDETVAVEEPTAPEQKILIPTGRSSLADVPKTGIRVFLTKPDGTEAMCFFKKTRRLEKGRWLLNGKWCDSITGKDIQFEPQYWRPVGY